MLLTRLHSHVVDSREHAGEKYTAIHIRARSTFLLRERLPHRFDHREGKKSKNRVLRQHLEATRISHVPATATHAGMTTVGPWMDSFQVPHGKRSKKSTDNRQLSAVCCLQSTGKTTCKAEAATGGRYNTNCRPSTSRAQAFPGFRRPPAGSLLT